MPTRKCRFCHTQVADTVVDLGMSPLSNSYITVDQLNDKEVYYPLHTFVCPKCFLVQLEEFASPDEIFSDYAYFSSYSDTWLTHARQYTEAMCERFAKINEKLVIEIASNDGYLLQYFKARGTPVLGIEPAGNVAQAAMAKGIPTLVSFFGRTLAQKLTSEGISAGLLLGNNVLAHVPDINDFVAGMQIILQKDGIITMEFPHLLKLMEDRQFDTIYHEHFSYLSFSTVEEIFDVHGLKVFDVEELSTHGGSLRVYACHADHAEYALTERVTSMKDKEIAFGLNKIETYYTFAEKVKSLKFELLEALVALKKQGKTIVGYGAPAKGNTLLNYCGIRTDFIEYTVDRSPHKQEKFLPGTHIPIFDPKKIRETQPDYVLILPWNIKDEIMEQLEYIKEWGGRFIVAIPAVEVL
ncbi:class I SAM-dependent methyltransferase [Sporomusa malonica]|uniref:Methyltransferase domain-containing protein n=1 Tax=Sporomusa malonica TaxID=112901 RepID=A0A1W2EUW2_9FIRM|nr:class I SAM-dependent methyltransferase [Sporomusa malonica]SMD13499.1 Methyltransferase domain-containing protein [Sporomusa malonica]